MSEGIEEDFEESRLVRPYALTGGRTRPSEGDLPLEALVYPTGDAPSKAVRGVAIERHKILDLCTSELLSVAEISAKLSLPIGVIRVLVSDLIGEGVVKASATRAQTIASSTDIRLLESVLNGIASL